MTLPNTPPAACIFDLDGTLVDSLKDIGESLNESLALLGLPPQSFERLRYMVGDGMPMLCRRAIGDSHPFLVDRLNELVRAKYRTRPLRQTFPYTGVRELVTRLAGRGVRLAVLSNKPHDLTTRIVAALWPAGELEVVYGYMYESMRKPDPGFTLRICQELEVSPRAVWFIGDTPTDIATARNAGTQCVAVTWGFRTHADLVAGGAEHIVDRPDEIG